MTMGQASRKHLGFTLLELLVVLTLVAMLTSVVVVKLGVPYRAARAGEVAERIAFTDQLMRAHARNFRQASRLVFDLDRGRVHVESGEQTQDTHFAFEMPPGVQLEEVRIADGAKRGGRAVVESPSDGITPTYAVLLSTRHGPNRWLLFAGLTGQVTYLEDERDVREMFSYCDTPGLDAH
jgi:prepilin-type N-terminal cleavage/methylation domain-containing protein